MGTRPALSNTHLLGRETFAWMLYAPVAELAAWREYEIRPANVFSESKHTVKHQQCDDEQ